MPPTHVSSSVPLTQNTAPILEFRCLFTPDLKKKQKKWQDGRLKFHTFNKRIMVYDDRTNYVGDTHYHTTMLEEGEELELERGVLVEVGELLGKQDQDLGEILQSVQGAAKSARPASLAPDRSMGRGATPGSAAGRYTTPAPAARQMSMMSSGPVRPLSALLGTPSGHHGRALMPTTSPFEDRQNRLASETPEPASKRRKVDSAPCAQPLWARTSLMQSGARGEISVPTERPVAREISYPDSIAPKARVKKTSEKASKPGYAKKLTGAVLDLSSTQNTNAPRSRQPINLDTSDEENDDGVSATGVREPAIAAPILPPVKRKPAPILPLKKPTEIVYPESIAPKAKPRRTFEKPSKAGYADKLTGAALNLSSLNMTNVTKRQPLNRQTSLEGEDDVDTAAVQERPRAETPILPPQPKRRPPAILPPSAPRAIVYPDSIAPKQKPRKTFEKKSKAGYAEKLIGAALNLSGAPSAPLKRSYPIQEEEDLLAQLAELRAQQEAADAVEMEELEGELPAPKAKKARTSKAKAPPADMGNTFDKENEDSLFVDNDFVNIDIVAPQAPAAKATKLKKPRAPKKKMQADVSPADVGVDDSAIGNGSIEEIETRRTKPNCKSLERNIPIRNTSQDRPLEDDNQQPQKASVDRISQTSLSASTGSLRIKAKPKRKMLMMQSIPPKSAASLAAASAPRPAILPGTSLLAKNQPPPEPSQATKTLIEFHDKQKEKLEERKRKIEARKRVPIEIHSSPEIEPQDDKAMDIPFSPIDLDEEEWVNPNAIKSTANPENAALGAGEEAPVKPKPDVTQQQPAATPSSRQTTNKSKPFTILKSGNDAPNETEESAISYTEIDNLLRLQRSSPLFSRAATAPGGLLDAPIERKLITPPPQPSLPQSSPAFTQAKERVKRPLPDFSASTKGSLNAAKVLLRPPPVPPFNSTEDGEPQSSLFVREDSAETTDTHMTKAPPSKDEQTVVQVLSSDDDDPSQPIRPPGRTRAAAVQESSSPDWPSDDESRSETEVPSPPSKAANARPIIDSPDSMAWPESQAEEGGFSSSPPPGPHHRELSAADEERLANGHSILVKIKSGIRSKEIIRPNSFSLIRNGDDNPFAGFVRPPQPIVRSRTGSFVDTEVEEGPESEDGVDEDEVMINLEAQAEEERQIARRREEAQRRTREFREKKERERVAKEQETQRLRLEAEARAEADRKERDEEARLQDEQTKAQQLLEHQERERVIEAEKKVAEEKKLETQRREAEEEKEREEKWRSGEQARLDAKKARQENLRLEAEAENKRRESEKKRKAEEEAAKLNAEKLRSDQLAKETREAQEEETRRQKEKDALDAQRKFDEQAKYEQMKLKLQAEIEAQMQEKYRAMEEELRVKLDAQNERDRLEKERQEKAEIQRQEALRIKELNEARQRELDAKELGDQRIADLREKEKRDSEQRKRKELADQARQQRAVEAAAAKLANSASSLPRSLPHALQGFQADEAEAEKDKISRQSDYQKRVSTSFKSLNGTTVIEHIDISEGGSFGEGDLILAQPKVTAFKLPAARSQAAMQPQAPRPPAAMTPSRSFHGFPTHLQAALYANGITTASHDFAPTFQSTPPAVGYKVPSTLHLSAPTFKPFCKPRSVPIVPKKAPKTMKEIRDEQRAERDQREDVKILPGFEEKGEILSWETGAWTEEAGDLFGWRPKVGDGDDD